jgi:hypothetical protein
VIALAVGHVVTDDVAALTTWLNGAALLVVKALLAVGEYTAAMECVPAVNVLVV